LRRSDPNGPGLRRRRCGRGFSYRDDADAPIDTETLSRIHALAIPPAWQDVWICADAGGHIQAVGVDAAGRRQYLYHEGWRARRDAEKFAREISLSGRLPALRRQVTTDLTSDGPALRQNRVLATAARLLDLGTFRIGNPEYADEHDTFGLTTLQRRHVQVHKDEVRFSYTAKYGLDRVEAVHDPDVSAVIRSLRRRRAGDDDELFGWIEGRRWIPLRSEHVNTYLAETTGLDVTAKDFRTWHATVLMALALAAKAPAGTKTSRRRALAAAYRDVAEQLGNTPAVVKASYVDPRLLDLYDEGVTLAERCKRLPSPEAFGGRGRRTVERAVIELLTTND
jgi:DNA topoisomerase IB